MASVFFDGWDPIFRTFSIGIFAYIGLLFFLRVSGKRTLTKLNAFDLVVTVALGSTLATILLSKDVSLAQGLTALGLLVFMQFVVTWISVRSRSFRNFVKSEPALLVRDGVFLDSNLSKERVTRDEIEAALRASGKKGVSQASSVVLETDGSISIIAKE